MKTTHVLAISAALLLSTILSPSIRNAAADVGPMAASQPDNNFGKDEDIQKSSEPTHTPKVAHTPVVKTKAAAVSTTTPKAKKTKKAKKK